MASRVFVGRLLLTLYFLAAGMSKLNDLDHTHLYMQSRVLPLSQWATTQFGAQVPSIDDLMSKNIVFGLGIAELLAAIIVIAGNRTSCLLLAMLMTPMTAILHNPMFFGRSATDKDRQLEISNFIRNMAVIGGLLIYSGTYKVARPIAVKRGNIHHGEIQKTEDDGLRDSAGRLKAKAP
eukprot:GILK01012485.1.p1 GENE.GILK01012485.1~~GILK01012485.1.p1  ORF type:complete len:179 (-),score=22.62 GILK01012485.1:85-621(-)